MVKLQPMHESDTPSSYLVLITFHIIGPFGIAPFMEYEARIEMGGLSINWLGFRDYWGGNPRMLIPYLLFAPLNWCLRRLRPRLLWRIFPRFSREPTYAIRWDEIQHFDYDDYSNRYLLPAGSLLNRGALHIDLIDGTSLDLVIPRNTDPDHLQAELVKHLNS